MGKEVDVSCLVNGVDVIVGMDAIKQMVGVIVGVGDTNAVSLAATALTMDEGCFSKESSISLDDQDFTATFDGARWVVAWKWRNGIEP